MKKYHMTGNDYWGAITDVPHVRHVSMACCDGQKQATSQATAFVADASDISL